MPWNQNKSTKLTNVPQHGAKKSSPFFSNLNAFFLQHKESFFFFLSCFMWNFNLWSEFVKLSEVFSSARRMKRKEKTFQLNLRKNEAKWNYVQSEGSTAPRLHWEHFFMRDELMKMAQSDTITRKCQRKPRQWGMMTLMIAILWIS